MHIDEHVLAAYLSGELTTEERKSVSLTLLEDRSLRECLHMASLALSAAHGEQGEGPNMRLLSTERPVVPGAFRNDRQAVRANRAARRAV